MAVYIFPKYWIYLQAFVRIASSFQEQLLTESFIMATSEFGCIWIAVG